METAVGLIIAALIALVSYLANRSINQIDHDIKEIRNSQTHMGNRLRTVESMVSNVNSTATKSLEVANQTQKMTQDIKIKVSDNVEKLGESVGKIEKEMEVQKTTLGKIILILNKLIIVRKS